MVDQEYLFELAGVKFGYSYTAAIFLFVPILRTVWILIETMIKRFIPLGNLKKRYCSNERKSWAVVTGATDGIGLGFC